MEEKYCIYEKIGVLFDELTDVLSDNFRFFRSRKKPIDVQYAETFERIMNVTEPMKVALSELAKVCTHFDIDEETKGNGFRSLIVITEKCLFKILELGIYIQKSRDRFFFRSYHNYMEIESYSQVVSRLFTVIQVALSLGTILDQDSLFADEERYPDEVDGLMSDFETISRECFYGRSFGFQFSPALQQSLNVVAVALAAYGDGFKRHNGETARALSSVLHSGKYVVDPELRAKRIVELTQHVSMPFCKSFWSLTENHGIQHVPMLICPSLSINKELKIKVEPLVVDTLNGKKVINPPFQSKGQKIIHARLLSYSLREGQGKQGSSENMSESHGRKMHGLSQNLLLHCHGGGFVAQSSKSHEIYLRNWAKELQCPILSIDYSLSPDATYPEALNECFYVYNWAILNCKSLGWTAERICFAGDSAGGNLMVALALKLIEEGMNLPNGLVIAYPPLRVQYAPSPSRMLALMDPLLPPGILKVCLRAYAGNVDDEVEETGSTTSLRTARFDDAYNPFDLDFGEAAVMAKHRHWSDVVGRRSLSDSNLASSDHYCVSRPLVGCLRCRKTSTEVPRANSRRGSESDSEVDGIQMHPIEANVTGDTQRRTKIVPVKRKRILPTSVNEFPETDELNLNEESESKSEIFEPKASENLKLEHKENESNALSGEDKHHKEDHTTNDTNDVDILIRRERRSKTIPNHRRSLSDSITESFQRLRANSVDFHIDDPSIRQTEVTAESIVRTQACLETESQAKKNADLGLTDCPRVDNSSKSDQKSNNDTVSDTRLRALYIKETSECVIVSRENLEKDPGGSFASGSSIEVEKFYERKSSSDSISSSMKKRCKDPLMSPLLASDEALKLLPKMIIVACSLDPLLDDSIDFVRRLKKLQKDPELFIVDDLPHGFLNLNFACNEAKEASDLIAACIKKVLTVGLRHVNSLPLSPEAAQEEADK
eukprot:gene16826-8294_t